MLGDARFSKCGLYRYVLVRCWLVGNGMCCFVMLNPSTATATELDPTVRRCLDYAFNWGYQGLHVLNLFAYRSTDPRVLRTVADPVGPENQHAFSTIIPKSNLVICAWGNGGMQDAQWRRGLNWIYEAGGKPMALRLTKQGQPQHPLYLPGSLEPIPYSFRSSL